MVDWNAENRRVQQGSFISRAIPPITLPSDTPLVCISINESWIPYVLGALSQLLQPTSWEGTQAAIDGAIDSSVDLRDIIGTAPLCSVVPTGTLVLAPTMLLSYTELADVLTGTGLAANVWLPASADHAFTVLHSAQLLQATVGGCVLIGSSVGGVNVGSRAVLDRGTGAEQHIQLGGGYVGPGEGYANALAGASSIWLPTLPAGDHTISVDVLTVGAGAVAYLLGATDPSVTSLRIDVLEYDVSPGGIGPPGPQGIPGPQGLIGPTGPAGANGANGTNGAVGPTGPAGVIGPRGITGAAGVDGAVGARGPQGIAGPPGATGPAGVNGVDGAIGATGPAGVNGVDGAIGATGPTGPPGATGPATVISDPPNPDGKSTAEISCAIADYLASELIYSALQHIVDGITARQSELSIFTGIANALAGVEPELALATNAFSILYRIVNSGTLSDYTDALADPALKLKISCAISGAMGADGFVTGANFAGIVIGIRRITYVHPAVVAAIGDFVQNLGIDGLRSLQIPGSINVGDCTSCDNWCYTFDFTASRQLQPRNVAQMFTDGVYSPGVGYTPFDLGGSPDACVIDLHSGALGDPTLTFTSSVRIKGHMNSVAPAGQRYLEVVNDDLSHQLYGLGLNAGAFDYTIFFDHHINGIHLWLKDVPCAGASSLTFLEIRGYGPDLFAPSDPSNC